MVSIKFFFGGRDTHGLTPRAQGGVEGSVRLLLTNNATYSFSFPLPLCQIRSVSFERFLRHSLTIATEDLIVTKLLPEGSNKSKQ